MHIFHMHPLPYLADPTIFFSAIRNAPGAVLFDSGRPTSQRGRYDLMSAWPLQTFQPDTNELIEDFAERIRSGLGELSGVCPAEPVPFAGGLMGYLSYEFGHLATGMPLSSEKAQIPNAIIGLYTWALISDHETHKSYIIFHPLVEPQERQRIISCFQMDSAGQLGERFNLARKFTPHISYDYYNRCISIINDYITAGDCYQVNFTQQFSSSYSGSPWAAYSNLRNHCATPFGGYINLGAHDAILSFSPERFILCRNGTVETRPIKGTMPRGRTLAEDQRFAEQLACSTKDRSENLMIVDLLRNDIGKNCKFGTVKVTDLFSIETYPNVHHLVSTIRGELLSNRDALDLLIDAFPGGSITGAPKRRAMEIIAELEPNRRSIYCGSLFYLDVTGNMDSSIAIRTLLARGGTISCWGGGGIIAESNAHNEYEESVIKIQNLLQCLERYFLL